MVTIKGIDVNTQNEYAKKFYLAHGFEIESEDKIDSFGKPHPITHLSKKGQLCNRGMNLAI